LNNYAVYGKNNPSNDILSEAELKATKGADLTTYIHNLTSYPHKIYYYGPAAESDLVATLNKLHKMPAKMLPVPPEKKFVKQVSEKPIIYFVHYEMVQAEIIWNYRSNEYKASEVPIITFFNEYFGGGMSSVVFQTIRESKALAYSTYSAYNTASEKGEYNGVMAYVGTQADKIQEAMTGMNELLQEIPQNESAFKNARDAVKANIETNRILKEQILFNMDAAQKRGLNYDIRKDTYGACDKITLAQLSDFHKAKFSGNPYTIAILGSKDKIDLTALAKYGEVKVLTLEEIFGY
jgi:predicted Zn-dependent peptidase